MIALLLVAGGERPDRLATQDPHASSIKPSGDLIAPSASIRRHGGSADSELRLPLFVPPPSFTCERRRHATPLDAASVPIGAHATISLTRSSRGPPAG